MAHEEFDLDPYQTLNVAQDATVEEIQETFKKLSRTFHPDRNSITCDSNTANASRQQFEDIATAKEILCNPEMRQAYDHFGAKGVEMMKRNIYSDLRVLKYRNDNAVHHLLKYYLKREASVELNKLVSCQGHAEITIDATSLYEEVVDLVFRHETIPQFVSNVWNGIPALQIVVNNDEYQAGFEPVKVVPDDYDFEAELYNEIETETQQMQMEEEEEEISLSELMNQSVEQQVNIIQNALNSGDLTMLKRIPVQRQSVSPQLSSFLLSLGYQYEYNDYNTILLSCTQYNDDNVYQSINLEWHKQMNRFTKLTSLFSIGLSSLSSQFVISRTINAKTNIDIALDFNFMDPFWKAFWRLFTTKYNDTDTENAADLFGTKTVELSETNNNSYLYILPELLTVAKYGIYAMYNFVRNGIESVSSFNMSGYPGFDLSFKIQRLIYNQWMAVSSIRMGREPSFAWNIFKNIGAKHWNFKINLGRNALSLLMKHSKKLKIDDTLRFYISLQLDVNHLLKFGCGFNKLFIDKDLKDMMEKYDDNKEIVASNIDMSASFGIDISLKHGLFIKTGIHRGTSQFNVPIKLSETTTSLKHILLSFSIPFLTYYGYKLYYKPYANRLHHNKVKNLLNNRGLALHQKRQFALKQQEIMKNESDQSRNIQTQNNALVILCAFYGDNVEKKMLDAIRIHFHLDDDDDDDDEKEEKEKQDEKEEEEKQTKDNKTEDVNPPPLLFNIYNYIKKENKNKNKNEEQDIKTNDNENNRYKKQLQDIDWLSIETDLENIMKMNQEEDIHLLSFINVRTVLQYLVDSEKSTLNLSSGTKSYLPGFYDCCPDTYSTKQLFVIYKFDSNHRYVTISDMFPLSLPNDSHLEWINCRH